MRDDRVHRHQCRTLRLGQRGGKLAGGELADDGVVQAGNASRPLVMRPLVPEALVGGESQDHEFADGVGEHAMEP